MPKTIGQAHSNLLLILILGLAAGLGGWGLRRQGLMTWDEGVYYDEARFVYQALQAIRQGPLTYENIARHTTGLPPRMARPLNTALNVAAMLLFGDKPWTPALVASLFGLLCILCTFLLGKQIYGEATGLLGAFLLAISPYFLLYRRLGLPEAAGTSAALLVMLWLLRLRGKEERRAWLNSLGLGCLVGLGLTINMRLSVLVFVALLFRLLWLGGPRWPLRLISHILLFLVGVTFPLALWELPYLLLSWHFPAALTLESYGEQLMRFWRTQQDMGRPPLYDAYAAVLTFLSYYEGPIVGLCILSSVWGYKRYARQEYWLWHPPQTQLLLACLGGQFLWLGGVTPFARYLCWIVPLLMILGASGLCHIQAQLPRRMAFPFLGLVIVVLVAWAIWRDVPLCRARGAMQEAREWLAAQGYSCLVTSNASLALAYFNVENVQPLPQKPEAARRLLEIYIHASRPCFVLLDRQQYVQDTFLMSEQKYPASAAGLIARRAMPLWEKPEFTGLFAAFAFEHNRHIAATWRMIHIWGRQAERLVIYEGAAAWKALQETR